MTQLEVAQTRSLPAALPHLRDGHGAIALTMLVAILLVRLIDLNYNSAFVDEAIYILNGQKALAGTSGFVGVRYMFGSYLYPVLAAIFGQIFGDELLGARVLSALATTAGAASVYLLTFRLLGSLPALFAMALFGFASNTRLVGQLATYDTLSVSLVAVSAAMLVYALTSDDPRRQDRLGFYAGVIFTLAILAKYMALLMAPTLALLLALLVARRDWPRVQVLLRSFAVPVVIGMTAYGLIFLDDLLRFVSGVNQYASQPAPRELILAALRTALLPTLLLALLGAGLLLLVARRHWPLVALLLLAGATIPVYHIAASNIRSMDKHVAFSLIFLTPLAAYALAQPLTWAAGRLHPERRGVPLLAQAGLALVLGVGWFAYNNQATSDMKLLWPNSSRVMAAMRELPMPPGTELLVEGGPTYELYLDLGEEVRLTDTWAYSYNYDGLRGEAALVAAVRDRVFDYVVLDSYYTQGLSYQLARTAEDAGYRIVFQDQVPISNGSVITTMIYAAPTTARETDHARP